MKATEMWRYLTRTRTWGYSNSFLTHVVFYITGAKARGEARDSQGSKAASEEKTKNVAKGDSATADSEQVRSVSAIVNRSVGSAILAAFGWTPAVAKLIARGYGEQRDTRRRIGNEKFTITEQKAEGSNNDEAPGAQEAMFGAAEGRLANGENSSGNSAAQEATAGNADGVLAYGYCWYMPEFNEETGILTLRQVQTATESGGVVTIS